MKIYELHFAKDGIQTLRRQWLSTANNRDPSSCLALLLTCRTINIEARHLFYSLNKLRILISACNTRLIERRLYDFVIPLSPIGRSSITYLTIEAVHFQGSSWRPGEGDETEGVRMLTLLFQLGCENLKYLQVVQVLQMPRVPGKTTVELQSAWTWDAEGSDSS